MKHIRLFLVISVLGAASCFASGNDTVMFLQRDSNGKLTCKFVRSNFRITRNGKTSSNIMTIQAPDCIISNKAKQVFVSFKNANVTHVTIPNVHDQTGKKASSALVDAFSVSLANTDTILFNNSTIQASLLKTRLEKVRHPPKNGPTVVRELIPKETREYIKDIEHPAGP